MPSSIRSLLVTSFALLAACGAEENIVDPTQSGSQNNFSAEIASVTALTPELGSFGIDLSHQDLSTPPGEDFFRFANGDWLDAYELPADRRRHGSFNELTDRSDARVRTIINDLTAIEPTQDSMEQKVSDYYLSYMNSEILNELGISPLRPGLSRLAQIDTAEELVGAFGRARIDTTASPISFGIGISPKWTQKVAHEMS